MSNFAEFSQSFGLLDNILFYCSIAVGAFVGIYFAYFAPKGASEEDDYLLGGRNMGIFPIALSLTASYVSGITLLGLPAEISVYGCQIIYTVFSYFIAAYIYNSQILPVFHDLQGLSINEYVIKRFNKNILLVGSILFFVASVGHLPIVMLVPALALEQVTGYNIHYITPVVFLVCIFCTSIGGIKAVVWTDVVQMISMLTCIIIIAIKGTYDVGGFSVIWERNVASGRIEPPFVNFDPTVRHSIFSVLIGGFMLVLFLGYMSAGQVQRHMALQTLERARKAVWTFTFVLIFTVSISVYIGLIIAAHYFECDPVTIKMIRSKDQLVPLFVTQSLGHIPGVLGIFISGIFSAALSSMSTVLNTLAGVFVEDWIRGCTKWNPTEHQATWIMRIFVVVLGFLSVILVFVVEKLGMVLQLSFSVASIVIGAMLTMFFSGLFLPWVTSTGALVGVLTAVISVTPIILRTQYYIGQGLLQFPAKPISLKGCTNTLNLTEEFIKKVVIRPETTLSMGPTTGDGVWYIFRISYMWYAPISIICGMTATAIVTYFSRTDLRNLDRRLVAPISRRWLPEDNFAVPKRGKHVIVSHFDKPDN